MRISTRKHPLILENAEPAFSPNLYKVQQVELALGLAPYSGPHSEQMD